MAHEPRVMAHEKEKCNVRDHDNSDLDSPKVPKWPGFFFVFLRGPFVDSDSRKDVCGPRTVWGIRFGASRPIAGEIVKGQISPFLTFLIVHFWGFVVANLLILTAGNGLRSKIGAGCQV